MITNENLKKELSKGQYNRFIEDAPVTTIGCANKSPIITREWFIVDTTIALQNMVIAAWTMGIGSCWIGDVKGLLKIPNKWKIVVLITFGCPAEHLDPRKKKPMTGIVSFNDFTNKEY